MNIKLSGFMNFPDGYDPRDDGMLLLSKEIVETLDIVAKKCRKVAKGTSSTKECIYNHTTVQKRRGRSRSISYEANGAQ